MKYSPYFLGIAYSCSIVDTFSVAFCQRKVLVIVKVDLVIVKLQISSKIFYKQAPDSK